MAQEKPVFRNPDGILRCYRDHAKGLSSGAPQKTRPDQATPNAWAAEHHATQQNLHIVIKSVS
jgi:hypothetical protein